MAAKPSDVKRDDGQSAGQLAGYQQDMQRLQGRIALITGGSRGIGAEVSRRFAAEGAQTILVARTKLDLQVVDDDIRATGGQPPCLVPLDLCRFELIDKLREALLERFGRLDILVANAGSLGALGPTAAGDPGEWKRVLELHLLANYHLIRVLDPLLRSSAAGRAIFVTCSEMGRAFWSAYTASKSALETMVRSYAAEVEYCGLRVNLLDPGAVRTRLRAQAFPSEDTAILATPESVTEHFVELAETVCSLHGKIIRASAPVVSISAAVPVSVNRAGHKT